MGAAVPEEIHRLEHTGLTRTIISEDRGHPRIEVELRVPKHSKVNELRVCDHNSKTLPDLYSRIGMTI
jgi:hypothetical protein